MFDELIRFLPPSKGGHEEWGRSEAPTPTDLILRGWGQRVVASGGGRQAGRPVVRPKPASSASRVAAHNRPCGAKAGARAAAVMPSATLRRTGAARAADQLFGRCTLHVPSARQPLTACQELPPTAAAAPHLHAVVAVPPLPRVPARAPAARRLAIADQRLLLLGLGSELGAGFRAGGRAVNLGWKRLLSKEKIETCRALSKRGRPKTVVYRGMMLPAHALLKQASSQGVIAARADFRVHEPRSAGACGRCGARGVDTVGPDASQNAQVSQGEVVPYLTSSVPSTGQPVGVRMCSGNADRVHCGGHRARSPSRDAG
jgi:hypothetical protein